MGKQMVIAFDVYGTLLHPNDEYSLAIQFLIKRFKARGNKIILWSGAGAEDAREAAEKLSITEYIDEYRDKQIYSDKPDFAFDDDEFAMFLAKNPTILV